MKGDIHGAVAAAARVRLRSSSGSLAEWALSSGSALQPTAAPARPSCARRPNHGAATSLIGEPVLIPLMTGGALVARVEEHEPDAAGRPFQNSIRVVFGLVACAIEKSPAGAP